MIEAHGMINTLLSCSSDLEIKELSAGEKESIKYVVGKLKSLTVSEIIEASHQEDGWKKASIA